jgi:hypothetical protein
MFLRQFCALGEEFLGRIFYEKRKNNQISEISLS